MPFTAENYIFINNFANNVGKNFNLTFYPRQLFLTFNGMHNLIK